MRWPPCGNMKSFFAKEQDNQQKHRGFSSQGIFFIWRIITKIPRERPTCCLLVPRILVNVHLDGQSQDLYISAVDASFSHFFKQFNLNIQSSNPLSIHTYLPISLHIQAQHFTTSPSICITPGSSSLFSSSSPWLLLCLYQCLWIACLRGPPTGRETV